SADNTLCIIEHFGNADAVPHTEPQRGASERNRRLRRLLARRSAGAVLKPSGGNCAVLPQKRKKATAFRQPLLGYAVCFWLFPQGKVTTR
ncbi:hypothetical protein, partial [uncultured Gemmiger sp.]|uniref:hypothetical protein n=1 Tax=uncultured Gemmiger sp. TaxID=1623490 RepID=UPI00266B52F5